MFTRSLDEKFIITTPFVAALEYAAPHWAAEKSRVESLLAKEHGAFIAVSDNIRAAQAGKVPDKPRRGQIHGAAVLIP